MQSHRGVDRAHARSLVLNPHAALCARTYQVEELNASPRSKTVTDVLANAVQAYVIQRPRGASGSTQQQQDIATGTGTPRAMLESAATTTVGIDQGEAEADAAEQGATAGASTSPELRAINSLLAKIKHMEKREVCIYLLISRAGLCDVPTCSPRRCVRNVVCLCV